MPEAPSYPSIQPEPEVKKLIKVDKPGVMAGTQQAKQSVRFRPLRTERRGRPRTRITDRRKVQFY